MSFPSRESVTETSFGSASQTHNVSMPATVDAGDLLIMIVNLMQPSGAFSLTEPSGWSTLLSSNDYLSGSPVGHAAVYGKDAVGDEDGTTVNVATTGDTTTGSAQVYRISGWGGTLATHVAISSAFSGGIGQQPDPSSLTSGFGVVDTLWIAVGCGGDDDGQANGYPANYTNGVDTLSGGGTNNSAEIWTAVMENAAASENPGNFHLTEVEAYAVATIAIAPEAGGGGARGKWKSPRGWW